MKKTLRLSGALLTVVLTFVARSADADDFHKRLTAFFKNSFPGEAFVANPYGADDRFAPRTIWINVPNAAGKTWRGNKTKAWIPFSSGTALYTDALVPLKRRAVAVKVQDLDTATKFALAASVGGTIPAGDVDATVEALRQKNVDVSIDLGEVEIEYGYYADFLNAQIVNQHILTGMNDLLRKTFASLPERRVITSALRVRGATVSLTGAGTTSVNADAALSPWLKKLGFEWNASRNAFESLKIGPEWRYIAYQSLYTNPDGKVSTADTTPDPTDFAEPEETGTTTLAAIFTPSQ